MKNQLLLFFTLCLFCIFFCGNAQPAVLDTVNENYRNSLKIYYELQSTKTKIEIEKIADKKIRKQFLSNYNEKIDKFQELIKKGVFIEHASYDNLVQSILDDIKKRNTTYNFNEIRLLLAISKDINAYNCGDGIVVLNLPIIFDIDNQFELAYIICHEIAHQKLNHVYNSMLNYCQQENSQEVKNQVKQIDKQKYNKSEIASGIFKKIVYENRIESRKHEVEADSLGYIFYRNTYPEYDNYAVETLKKLKTIDVEKDSLTKGDFIKLFETSSLKFKEEWIEGDISKYNYQKSAKFWNIDSLRTHPDCDTRIALLNQSFKMQEKLKSVEAHSFNLQRKDADKEYVFGLYFLEEYGESLYYTLLKIKNNPKDLYYRKMVYDNLIKLEAARNSYTLNKYLEIENPKYSENYNQFLCLIRNLRKSELNQIIQFYKN